MCHSRTSFNAGSVCSRQTLSALPDMMYDLNEERPANDDVPIRQELLRRGTKLPGLVSNAQDRGVLPLAQN